MHHQQHFFDDTRLTCRNDFGGIGWSGLAFLPPPTTIMELDAPHPVPNPQFMRPMVASCPLFCFTTVRALAGIDAWIPIRPDGATLKEAVAVSAAGMAVEGWVRPRMQQRRCNLLFNSKGYCTSPEGRCSPEETRKTDKYSIQMVEDTQVLCKDGKLVTPKVLQRRAVSWYHHYLHLPGHTRLKETLHAMMYWKGMRNTIRSYAKTCCTCQVKKRHKHKYGKRPAKLVITNPWQALCVDLIEPYTLTGKDGIDGDFMWLTMIDPASSWFEIVELPVTAAAVIPMDTKGQQGTKMHNNTKLPYFDKSSAMISNLVNRTWFNRYPHCQGIIYDNGSEYKLRLEALC